LEPKLVCQVQAPSLNTHAGNNSVFPQTITTIWTSARQTVNKWRFCMCYFSFDIWTNYPSTCGLRM